MFRILLLLVLLIVIVSLLLGRNVFRSFKRGVRVSAGEKAMEDLMNSGRDHPTFIAEIPAIAERHREQIQKSFGEKLDYRKSDFARLDTLISKAWGEKLPKNLDRLVLTFGAYFGESIRRLRGGSWDYEPDRGYCLRSVGEAATVYPFEKVKKRFQNGDQDALSVFYTALAKKLDKSD